MFDVRERIRRAGRGGRIAMCLALTVMALWPTEAVALGNIPDYVEHLDTFTIYMVLLLSLTIFLEIVFHNLHHALAHAHRFKYLYYCYEKVVNELMILGLVAFTVFMSHLTSLARFVSDIVEKWTGSDFDEQFEVFELVHMGIFSGMVTFIAVSGWLMYLVNSIIEEYHVIEAKRGYWVLRAYDDIKDEWHDMTVVQKIFSWNFIRIMFQRQKEAWYYKFRARYIEQHNRAFNYNFAAHLGYSMRYKLLVQLMGILPSEWVVVMTIAIINFVRQDYLNVTLGGTNKNAWWLMLPVGWSLTLILVVLMIRMRTVTHRILRTDFMALAKDSFKRRAGCCGCTSCEINRYARPCCGIESCCCCFRPCRPEGKWDMAVEYADENDEVDSHNSETSGEHDAHKHATHHGFGHEGHEGSAHKLQRDLEFEKVVFGPGLFHSYVPSLHARYFLLNRPHIPLRVFQTVMLLQTWYFLLTLLFIRESPWYMTIVEWLSTVVNIFILAPRYLYLFALTTEVGHFSRRQVAWAYWQRLFRAMKHKKAIGFSLANLVTSLRFRHDMEISVDSASSSARESKQESVVVAGVDKDVSVKHVSQPQKDVDLYSYYTSSSTSS